MHHAIQDSVGQRGGVQERMPLLDVELAGNDGGGLVVAIVEDFEQAADRLCEDYEVI